MVVKRLFKLWKLYGTLDVLWLFKDFQNFMACCLTETIGSLASVSGIWLLAERFSGIGSLSREQVLFMLGYSLCVSGITNTFFNMNILHISRRIGRGQLDHVLMQPQPIWAVLLTEGFVPVSGSGVLLSGIGVLLYGIRGINLQIGFVWVVLLFLSIVLSAAIKLIYSFLWGSLAFYAPAGAEEICSSVVGLFESLKGFPLNAMGSIGQTILLTILPVGLCAWYPAMALTTGKVYESVVYMCFITGLLLIITLLAFKRGMRNYAKTGSYRYHDRGHRR